MTYFNPALLRKIAAGKGLTKEQVDMLVQKYGLQDQYETAKKMGLINPDGTMTDEQLQQVVGMSDGKIKSADEVYAMFNGQGNGGGQGNGDGAGAGGDTGDDDEAPPPPASNTNFLGFQKLPGNYGIGNAVGDLTTWFSSQGDASAAASSRCLAYFVPRLVSSAGFALVASALAGRKGGAMVPLLGAIGGFLLGGPLMDMLQGMFGEKPKPPPKPQPKPQSSDTDNTNDGGNPPPPPPNGDGAPDPGQDGGAPRSDGKLPPDDVKFLQDVINDTSGVYSEEEKQNAIKTLQQHGINPEELRHTPEPPPDRPSEPDVEPDNSFTEEQLTEINQDPAHKDILVRQLEELASNPDVDENARKIAEQRLGQLGVTRGEDGGWIAANSSEDQSLLLGTFNREGGIGYGENAGDGKLSKERKAFLKDVIDSELNYDRQREFTPEQREQARHELQQHGIVETKRGWNDEIEPPPGWKPAGPQRDPRDPSQPFQFDDMLTWYRKQEGDPNAQLPDNKGAQHWIQQEYERARGNAYQGYTNRRREMDRGKEIEAMSFDAVNGTWNSPEENFMDMAARLYARHTMEARRVNDPDKQKYDLDKRYEKLTNATVADEKRLEELYANLSPEMQQKLRGWYEIGRHRNPEKVFANSPILPQIEHRFAGVVTALPNSAFAGGDFDANDPDRVPMRGSEYINDLDLRQFYTELENKYDKGGQIRHAQGKPLENIIAERNPQYKFHVDPEREGQKAYHMKSVGWRYNGYKEPAHCVDNYVADERNKGTEGPMPTMKPRPLNPDSVPGVVSNTFDGTKPGTPLPGFGPGSRPEDRKLPKDSSADIGYRLGLR